LPINDESKKIKKVKKNVSAKTKTIPKKIQKPLIKQSRAKK